LKGTGIHCRQHDIEFRPELVFEVDDDTMQSGIQPSQNKEKNPRITVPFARQVKWLR
jgi:hypothetical protein